MAMRVETLELNPETLQGLNESIRRGTLFWDVDTQHDFMDRDGALYVHGSEDIKPRLRELTEYANRRGIRKGKSADRHFGSDPEMQANGGTFPFHCMDGTYGQLSIPETESNNPMFIENRRYMEDEIARALRHEGELVFEKQHYDVFTNPNTEIILLALRPDRIVVYGVATDYCDKAAALGMRRLGFGVYLVEDAIRAVTPEGGEVALKEMYAAGVNRTTTEEVLAGIFG